MGGGAVELTEQHVGRQTPEAPKQRLLAPPPGSGSHTPSAGLAAPDPRCMHHPSGLPRPSSARCWKRLKVRPANQLVYLPQVVIAASQIQWTADVTKCLMTAKERSDKKILKVMKKKQVGI